MIVALGLVYRKPAYALSAVLLFVGVLAFYLWSGQVLVVTNGGVAILVQPDLIVASVVLAALFGVSLPMQVFALRLAIAGIRQTGGTVLGLLIGGVSISCCTPVLLPALLSLIGFSGTSILSANLTIHRYFVPLALLGTVLLLFSVASTASSLSATCAVPHRDER